MKSPIEKLYDEFLRLTRSANLDAEDTRESISNCVQAIIAEPITGRRDAYIVMKSARLQLKIDGSNISQRAETALNEIEDFLEKRTLLN